MVKSRYAIQRKKKMHGVLLSMTLKKKALFSLRSLRLKIPLPIGSGSTRVISEKREQNRRPRLLGEGKAREMNIQEKCDGGEGRCGI